MKFTISLLLVPASFAIREVEQSIRHGAIQKRAPMPTRSPNAVPDKGLTEEDDDFVVIPNSSSRKKDSWKKVNSDSPNLHSPDSGSIGSSTAAELSLGSKNGKSNNRLDESWNPSEDTIFPLFPEPGKQSPVGSPKSQQNEASGSNILEGMEQLDLNTVQTPPLKIDVSPAAPSSPGVSSVSSTNSLEQVFKPTEAEKASLSPNNKQTAGTSPKSYSDALKAKPKQAAPTVKLNWLPKLGTPGKELPATFKPTGKPTRRQKPTKVRKFESNSPLSNSNPSSVSPEGTKTNVRSNLNPLAKEFIPPTVTTLRKKAVPTEEPEQFLIFE